MSNDPEKGNEKGAASPYSTGGGGVSLERRYGATLFAAVLTGDPIQGLGDEVRPEHIRFQALPSESPVDDYEVTGVGRNGERRTLAVGVRRAPTIAKSDEKFVKLVADFVRALEKHQSGIEKDEYRLGLAVAIGSTGAAELERLTEFARAQNSDGEFRAHIAREKATTKNVRKRFAFFEEVVAEASKQLQDPKGLSLDKQLAWKLLRAIRVIHLDLETDQAKDRTSAVVQLRRLCDDADAAFAILDERCGTLSRHAGSVGVKELRTWLRGRVNLREDPKFAGTWELIKSLEGHLRSRVDTTVRQDGGASISLPRTALVTSLTDRLRQCSARNNLLLVSGEPDVGKSALALLAADNLRASGDAVVLALSLRDLPRTPFEFERALGATLEEVLSGAEVRDVRIILIDGAEAVLEGWMSVLDLLLRAAKSVGFGVALVSRNDAKEATPRAEAEFLVPDLDDEEVAKLVSPFPALAKLEEEDRAKWLLRRPGLVQVLLSNEAHANLPSGALSEADVFNAVWRSAVRRDERRDPGAGSPDGREAALLALVRTQLLGTSEPATVPDTDALPALRSDGLLLSRTRRDAWQTGDDFSEDLYRDFALARTLQAEDSEKLLLMGKEPRWCLRGARLACQVRLLAARENHEPVRVELQLTYESLAESLGARWRDIPWEAALSLGDPLVVLQGAEALLLADGGKELSFLLSVVKRRFFSAGAPCVREVAA